MKATKIGLKWLKRGDPPVCFEHFKRSIFDNCEKGKSMMNEIKDTKSLCVDRMFLINDLL